MLEYSQIQNFKPIGTFCAFRTRVFHRWAFFFEKLMGGGDTIFEPPVGQIYDARRDSDWQRILPAHL